MRRIEELFEKKRSKEEFLHKAGNIYRQYGNTPEYKSILLDNDVPRSKLRGIWLRK